MVFLSNVDPSQIMKHTRMTRELKKSTYPYPNNATLKNQKRQAMDQKAVVLNELSRGMLPHPNIYTVKNRERKAQEENRKRRQQREEWQRRLWENRQRVLENQRKKDENTASVRNFKYKYFKKLLNEGYTPEEVSLQLDRMYRTLGKNKELTSALQTHVNKLENEKWRKDQALGMAANLFATKEAEVEAESQAKLNAIAMANAESQAKLNAIAIANAEALRKKRTPYQKFKNKFKQTFKIGGNKSKTLRKRRNSTQRK